MQYKGNIQLYPNRDTFIIVNYRNLLHSMPNDNEKILVDFGKRLQKMRINKGYSTREFAYKADISHSSVVRLESGQTNPSLTVLLKLAEALEEDLNALAGKKSL